MPLPPAARPVLELPSLIGHRGAAGSAPENTLAGFRRAAALGLAWVECDLRLSAEGEVVLLHDATLDRTSDGSGLLAQHRLADLAALDAGSWFSSRFAGERIPTLAQALECWHELGLGANLELKTEDGSAEALVSALTRLLARRRPHVPLLISSFEPEALRAAQKHLPDLPRGLLVERLTEAGLEWAQSLNSFSVHAGAAPLRRDEVQEARLQGLEVLAYTVNEAARAQELWSWGVRAIFTDFPERMTAPPGRSPPPAAAPPG
jgi:glycerophosphoryl diester phosphodiesterase